MFKKKQISQRDAYAKFLNMPKTKNAKSYGAGWGGEMPTQRPKGSILSPKLKSMMKKGIDPRHAAKWSK